MISIWADFFLYPWRRHFSQNHIHGLHTDVVNWWPLKEVSSLFHVLQTNLLFIDIQNLKQGPYFHYTQNVWTIFHTGIQWFILFHYKVKEVYSSQTIFHTGIQWCILFHYKEVYSSQTSHINVLKQFYSYNYTSQITYLQKSISLVIFVFS